MDKITIYCTVGLPASGKSTWAREMCDKNPGQYKLVSKDELRLMLDNGRWSNGNEKFVMRVQESIIENAITSKVNLIIHDTNFGENIARIERVVNGRAKIVVQDFTDVSVTECIERDAKRGEKSVGRKVIMDMYNRYLRVEPEKPDYIDGAPDAIICDLDGTLALMNGRSPYDASTCENDILNMAVANVLRRFPNVDILFTSGRSDKYRDETVRWLNSKGFDVTGFGGNRLLMRRDGDNRKDAIVKQEIYDRVIKGFYNVLFVIDDRKQVCQMWYKNGLDLFRVGDPDAEF